jgi:hypothetical protein
MYTCVAGCTHVLGKSVVEMGGQENFFLTKLISLNCLSLPPIGMDCNTAATAMKLHRPHSIKVMIPKPTKSACTYTEKCWQQTRTSKPPVAVVTAVCVKLATAS